MKLVSRLLFVSATLATTLSVSCSRFDKRSAVEAPSDVKDSFTIEQLDNKLTLSSSSSFLIGINKKSLDKEFLLQSELIVQPVIPQYNSLKSRVIAFKEYNDHLYMLETNDGHSVSNELPQNLVLTKFKIVKQSPQMIYFDFSEGMSKLFLSKDWNAQDMDGGEYRSSWQNVDLDVSYVANASIDKQNNLTIQQVAQAKIQASGMNQDVPIEARYYLTPYIKNPGFQSVKSTSFDRMGFFEVAPSLKQGSGEKIIHAAKWDERKPIVYAISANTPKEYVEPIKEGVLYWNKAFGKEVIKVEMAPEGVTAPNFHHNLVQWVDWKDAGFAYADAQMDPRTGEVLHAQVFLTSVFGFGGVQKARRLLKKLMNEENPTTPQPGHPSLTLSGFENNLICHFNPNRQELSTSLSQLLAEVGSEEEMNAKILKVAQDYVREVVAHEIGHTLGLRHNFAGSSAANFELKDRKTIFDRYLKDGKTPEGIITSSSMMEYQKFEESSLTGDQILSTAQALDYDFKTIQTLYMGKTYSHEEIPLFCTDSHVGEYIDCNLFDAGPSAFEYVIQQEQETMKGLPYLLLERYIAVKSPMPGQQVFPLSKGSMNPFEFAATALANRIKFLQSLSSDSKILKVQRTFELINDLNTSEVGQAETAYLESEVKRLGGVEVFLKSKSFAEIKALHETFLKLLDSPEYSSGVGANGQAYAFSEMDKTIIKNEVQKFFSRLPVAMLIVELSILDKSKNVIDHQLGLDLLDVIARKATMVVSLAASTIKGEVKNASGESVAVEVPQFIFPMSLRIMGVNLLSDRGEDVLWSRKIRTKLFKVLKAHLDEALKQDIDNLAIEDLSDDMARWVIENQKVLNAFRAL